MTEVHEFDFPFHYRPPLVEDDEGFWCPGTRYGTPANGEQEHIEYAEGLGRCILTVVERHKIAGYSPRVFYLRHFINPFGEKFGRKTLNVCSIQVFRRLARRWKREYQRVQGFEMLDRSEVAV